MIVNSLLFVVMLYLGNAQNPPCQTQLNTCLGDTVCSGALTNATQTCTGNTAAGGQVGCNVTSPNDPGNIFLGACSVNCMLNTVSTPSNANWTAYQNCFSGQVYNASVYCTGAAKPCMGDYNCLVLQNSSWTCTQGTMYASCSAANRTNTGYVANCAGLCNLYTQNNGGKSNSNYNNWFTCEQNRNGSLCGTQAYNCLVDTTGVCPNNINIVNPCMNVNSNCSNIENYPSATNITNCYGTCVQNASNAANSDTWSKLVSCMEKPSAGSSTIFSALALVMILVIAIVF